MLSPVFVVGGISVYGLLRIDVLIEFLECSLPLVMTAETRGFTGTESTRRKNEMCSKVNLNSLLKGELSPVVII